VVASSLGLDVEHTHDKEEVAAGFMHPWAREMHRRGVTFNGRERDRLFLGAAHGGFLDLSDLSGADSGLDGRGLVAADFDRDGDLDLFAHHLQRGSHALLRNDLGTGPDRGSLTLELRDDTTPNREGVGATVTVAAGGRRVAQVVARGSGFASCGPAELVFGTGSARTARVEVRWPDGDVESFGDVEVSGRHLLVRGVGKARSIPTEPRRLRDPLPPGIDLALGAKSPAIVLVDATGERVELEPTALARERGLELHFWASYCAPCVRDLPHLAREDGPAIVAISVDPPRDHARAAALLEKATGGRVRALFVSQSEADNLGRLDDVVDLSRLAIPMGLLLDREGRFQAVRR
jgi:thiol-disulfide isomerase/thioredoxin